jgi:hypothetical protein
MERKKIFTSRSAIRTILGAGFVAGTLDILCAMLHYYLRSGKDPLNVLMFIASGVFGKMAFAGGFDMILWGLFFHFLISCSWTLFFFAVFPKLSFLSKSTIFSGLLFGIVIWIVMNQLVVPLSRTPKIPFDAIQTLIGIFILMFAVGLPVSTVVNNYYSNRSSARVNEDLG